MTDRERRETIKIASTVRLEWPAFAAAAVHGKHFSNVFAFLVIASRLQYVSQRRTRARNEKMFEVACCNRKAKPRKRRKKEIRVGGCGHNIRKRNIAYFCFWPPICYHFRFRRHFGTKTNALRKMRSHRCSSQDFFEDFFWNLLSFNDDNIIHKAKLLWLEFYTTALSYTQWQCLCRLGPTLKNLFSF